MNGLALPLFHFKQPLGLRQEGTERNSDSLSLFTVARLRSTELDERILAGANDLEDGRQVGHDVTELLTRSGRSQALEAGDCAIDGAVGALRSLLQHHVAVVDPTRELCSDSNESALVQGTRIELFQANPINGSHGIPPEISRRDLFPKGMSLRWWFLTSE